MASRIDKPRIGLQKATSAIIFSKIGGANGKSMLGEQKTNSGIKDGKAGGGKNKKKLASQKETSKTLFRKIGEGDDEPRLGIQKATAGILAAFKHIETKVKYENVSMKVLTNFAITAYFIFVRCLIFINR